MGFLADKNILITGMLSNRSIAYGVAKACHREGARLAFTYQGDRVQERVIELAKEFDSTLVFPCDVSLDAEIADLFAKLGAQWGGLDGLVHSIAFAPREALTGDFLDNTTREAFRMAHDISAYSFAALAKAARPMLKGRESSLLTMTYLGSVRSMPKELSVCSTTSALLTGLVKLGQPQPESNLSSELNSGSPDTTST